MTFKDWLLQEQPTVRLPMPTTLKVWTDDQGAVKSFVVNFIDIRSEDWSLEDQNRYATSQGVLLSKKPSAPLSPFMKFSAPLADGTYLNCDLTATISQEPQFQVIRKDWAKFAEFIHDRMVIKRPAYSRAADAVAS